MRVLLDLEAVAEAIDISVAAAMKRAQRGRLPGVCQPAGRGGPRLVPLEALTIPEQRQARIATEARRAAWGQGLDPNDPELTCIVHYADGKRAFEMVRPPLIRIVGDN